MKTYFVAILVINFSTIKLYHQVSKLYKPRSPKAFIKLAPSRAHSLCGAPPYPWLRSWCWGWWAVPTYLAKYCVRAQDSSNCPQGCPSSLLCVRSSEVMAPLSNNCPGHGLPGQLTLSHSPHPAAIPTAPRRMGRHWTPWLFRGMACSLWWTDAAVSMSPTSSLRTLH